MSVRPSVRPSVRLSVRPSVRPSDRPSVRPSVPNNDHFIFPFLLSAIPLLFPPSASTLLSPPPSPLVTLGLEGILVVGVEDAGMTEDAAPINVVDRRKFAQDGVDLTLVLNRRPPEQATAASRGRRGGESTAELP